MTETSHITDLQRMEFMRKFCAEVFHDNGLIIDQWEKNFVTGWRASSRPSQWFIGERPKWTDRLWMKYGVEIKWPFPLPPRAQSALPQAEADACEFLVMGEDRRQRPCNDPAELVNSKSFRYCRAHGEQAQKAIKRRGGHMELRTYLPKK